MVSILVIAMSTYCSNHFTIHTHTHTYIYIHTHTHTHISKHHTVYIKLNTMLYDNYISEEPGKICCYYPAKFLIAPYS